MEYLSEHENSRFLGTEEFDNTSPLQSGVYQKSPSDKYQTEGGNSIDPKLAMVLEYFKELYHRQRDLFKNIFPGINVEFSEFLKKLGVFIFHDHVKSDDGRYQMGVNVKTMQRSLSVGSPRSRALNGGDESDLKLERFKIRTVGGNGGDQGGGGNGGDGGGGGGGGEGGKPPVVPITSG